MRLVVRSPRSDADVVAAVREEVARLDAEVPVHAVRSMQDVAAASPGVPARRVLTATFMGFALLAIVPGAIGLFGVVAHEVASRRPELALRLALGADPMRILIGTLGQGARMVGAGLVVGGVLSIRAVRALDSMAFGTGRLDPLNVGAAAAVLIVVGAMAVLPAARACGAHRSAACPSERVTCPEADRDVPRVEPLASLGPFEPAAHLALF
jgi:hypothetical protein